MHIFNKLIYHMNNIKNIKNVEPQKYAYLQWFAVKAGLAGAAVYYLNEQGVWKDSKESLKAYDSLKTVVKPYVDQVTAQIPVELPQIPPTENIRQSALQYWNKGVMGAFDYLSRSPDYLGDWTGKGIKYIQDNADLQKLTETTPAKS